MFLEFISLEDKVHGVCKKAKKKKKLNFFYVPEIGYPRNKWLPQPVYGKMSYREMFLEFNFLEYLGT